ncbi:hypothetical protein POTOM_034072 [Populus tomentosa]|uniref:Uncharacterized protein n=1 Tax=Populus tomentosa TaxID=118781 RepID=A0A8X7ZCH1_POPTO|nr:hypothetical protein POTOM_034072 [Populus tomentosa]
MGGSALYSQFCTSQARGYADPGKRVCSPRVEGLEIAMGVCRPARLGLQPWHVLLQILGCRSSYPLTWVCNLARGLVLEPCVCSLGLAADYLSELIWSVTATTTVDPWLQSLPLTPL